MATSIQQPYNVADDYLAMAFVIQQLLTKVSTVTLVKVVSCTNNGGVSPYGFVNVIPLVNQVTGDNQTVPHGTIYRLPYMRLQGGANAVILDPQPDDIRLAAFCSRDISAVKSDPASAIANANAGKGGAPPGSGRQFDMADGLYIGGFLNGVPTQYVRFASGGVTVLSPTKITLQAPSIELVGPVVASSTVVAAGDVTGDGVSLKNHTHGGVTPGGGSTGPPN